MNSFEWLAEVVLSGEKTSRISTGVPVSQQLILTTLHSISENEKEHIKVRFVHDIMKSHPWRKAHILWHDQVEGVTVALLEFEKYTDLVPFIYSGQKPTSREQWSGAAFRDSSAVQENALSHVNETVGLAGHVQTSPSLSNSLELSVYDNQRGLEKWISLAGAPVVVNGMLLGIIVSASQDGLKAVSISQLLTIRQFRALIGYVDRTPLITHFKSALVETLKESNEAYSALYVHALEKELITPEKVVDKLFQMDMESFSIAILHASSSTNIKSSNTRKILLQILTTVLPFLYDSAVIAAVKSQLSDSNHISLPICTQTIAEIIMAAADDRPVAYRMPSTREEFPVGNYSIAPFPESGFHGQEAVRTFEDELAKRFVLTEDRHLDKHFQRQLINDELEYLSETQSAHHYFVNSSIGTVFERTIETLKERFPKLIFLSLIGADTLRYERKVARPLRDIYALEANGLERVEGTFLDGVRAKVRSRVLNKPKNRS